MRYFASMTAEEIPPRLRRGPLCKGGERFSPPFEKGGQGGIFTAANRGAV